MKINRKRVPPNIKLELVTGQWGITNRFERLYLASLRPLTKEEIFALDLDPEDIVLSWEHYSRRLGQVAKLSNRRWYAYDCHGNEGEFRTRSDALFFLYSQRFITEL